MPTGTCFWQLAAGDGSTNSVSGTVYLTADHLGSTRLITSSANTLVNGTSPGTPGTAIECRDYLPFGEQILVGSGSPRLGLNCLTTEIGVRQQFTSKERDSESGLDYFGARYFSGAMGRFTSPDAPFADQMPEDPQSWNLYSYVRNNPLIYRDYDGREMSCTQDDAGNIKCTVTKPKNPPPPPDVPLSPYAQEFYNQMSARRQASNQMIATFVAADAVFATAYVSTYALPVILKAAVPLAPLIPAAGDKMRQIIARLGPAYYGNQEGAMKALTEVRDTASAAGTTATGFYIQAGSTIYKVGSNYLTVSSGGQILSYVQNATPGVGVAAKYIELGGK